MTDDAGRCDVILMLARMVLVQGNELIVCRVYPSLAAYNESNIKAMIPH